MIECDACHEMKPEEGGETIVAFTHRVEGRAVGVDREWICADCVEEAALAEEDRAVSEWGYHNLK